MRKFGGLRKTKDNFNHIYEIIEKASNEGDISAIKYSVDEKYSDVCNENGYNMICEAAWRNNLCLVKHLFNNGADMRSRNIAKQTILHSFSLRGNLAGVKFALKYIDINEKTNCDNTPLDFAIFFNQADVCEYLSSQPNIDKNAKNYCGKTPLQFAKDFNKQNIIEILLKNGFTE